MPDGHEEKEGSRDSRIGIDRLAKAAYKKKPNTTMTHGKTAKQMDCNKMFRSRINSVVYSLFLNLMNISEWFLILDPCFLIPPTHNVLDNTSSSSSFFVIWMSL